MTKLAFDDITRRALMVGIAAPVALAQTPSAQLKSTVLKMAAKPEPFEFDPATSAVIVVDMQNDFGTKGGMFERAGIDISMIQKAVPPTAKVLSKARQKGVRIVYLKMAFQPDLSDMGSADCTNRVRHMRLGVGKEVSTPDGRPSRILIRDTWNTDIVAELKPQPEDVVMYKPRFSGFYQTDLDATLKKMGIKHLIFTGCTTSICVESTIRDAMFRDYLCVLLADCAGEPIGNDFARSNHEASLLSIQTLLGWVSSSDELMKTFGA